MRRIINGKRILVITLVIGLLFSTTIYSLASNYEIQSTGDVKYQSQNNEDPTTLFAVEDITNLNERIDKIEDVVLEGKGILAGKLNSMGTNTDLTDSSTFDELASGIDNSQILPNMTVVKALASVGLTATDVISAASASGSSITGEENLAPITAENITLGKARYVDGELIVGTGEDNNNYYQNGKTTIIDLGTGTSFRWC